MKPAENPFLKIILATLFFISFHKSCVIVQAFNQNIAIALSQKSTTNSIPYVTATSKRKSLTTCNSKAGSFFHPVPSSDPDDDNKKDDNSSNNNENVENDDQSSSISNDAFDFDRNLNDMLKKRSTSIASEPSTIDGVPTSKAKGFGVASNSKKPKSSSPVQNNKPYIGIGKPDKPLNDINNPEFDDQGYTLYTNEETGEKKRVFEALVDYPCKFKIKVIGANESSFVEEIVQVVADTCNVDNVEYSERKNGKWISITFHAPVENAEMLYTLYENIDKDPRVKFKF